jgi:pimeloyl-ACP methyl ester carboxylesterase
MRSHVFALGLLAAVAAAAPTGLEKTCIPSSIDWVDCSKQYGTPELKCANITVPIDYSTPCNGQTVRLALVMRPARKPSNRIGPLLMNTGGPGDPVISYLVDSKSGVYPFPSELRDRFDLVAMDPRGIGFSEPIACNHTVFNEMQSLNQFPATEEDFEALYDASQRYGESCVDMTGPLIFHLDSKTVARDLETVRSALGDERMTYLGYSYGTIIGQAYLGQYPDNVRASR